MQLAIVPTPPAREVFQASPCLGIVKFKLQSLSALQLGKHKFVGVEEEARSWVLSDQGGRESLVKSSDSLVSVSFADDVKRAVVLHFCLHVVAHVQVKALSFLSAELFLLEPHLHHRRRDEEDGRDRFGQPAREERNQRVLVVLTLFVAKQEVERFVRKHLRNSKQT